MAPLRRPKPSLSSRRFKGGRSLRAIVDNAVANEILRPNRTRFAHSTMPEFGPRGSQVQILPLRPKTNLSFQIFVGGHR